MMKVPNQYRCRHGQFASSENDGNNGYFLASSQMIEIREENINDNFLKLSSMAILEKPLDVDKNYIIQTEIEINDINLKDLKNEKWDRIYKAKVKGLIAIKAEKEKPIIAIRKDKMSPSQLLRYDIELLYQRKGNIGFEFISNEYSQEEFYQKSIEKIRKNIYKILKNL